MKRHDRFGPWPPYDLWPPKNVMAPLITLAPAAVEVAFTVAGLRVRNAKQHGASDTSGAANPANHVIGALGEVAVAVWYGVPFADPEEWASFERRKRGDLLSVVEVKASTFRNAPLRVREAEPRSGRVYVLTHLLTEANERPAEVALRGWMTAEHARQTGYQIEANALSGAESKATEWWVPQQFLETDWHECRKAIERARRASAANNELEGLTP